MAKQATIKKATVAKVPGAGKLFPVGGQRVYKPARAAARPATSARPKGVKMPTGTGISVRVIRQTFGLSQEELARVTGYSTRSIAGWEAGQALSDSARQKLTETERLRSALAELMPAHDLGDWLRSPNPAFEGQPPIQVIERGEADRLWRMIFQIDANVAS